MDTYHLYTTTRCVPRQEDVSVLPPTDTVVKFILVYHLAEVCVDLMCHDDLAGRVGDVVTKRQDVLFACTSPPRGALARVRGARVAVCHR